MSDTLIAESSVFPEWDTIISPKKNQYSLNLSEIWRYRDLLMLFAKKDIITVYKQTILGPLWFLLQPIFTTVIYMVIFGRMGGMADKTVPPILFFLSSVTLWNFFSDTLNVTSKTFTDNASVFGKVYFPRIILPLSKLISGLIKFLIQFVLFLAVWIYFLIFKSQLPIHPNAYIVLFPVLLVVSAFIGLGFGLFITAMTTKYRDLTFLVSFGVQLLMFATPVIYPVSNYPKYQFILFLNPLTSIFEAFKYAFLGSGVVSLPWLCYSTLFSVIVVLFGMLVFNNVEKRFIDTV